MSRTATKANPGLSPAAKSTALLKEGIRQFVLKYYRNATVELADIYFLAEDDPYSFWSASVAARDGLTEEERKLAEVGEFYFIWDGAEFGAYDKLEDVLTTYIAHVKQRRSERLLGFLSSPLIISGTIGILLVLMTAGLLLSSKSPPPELWSILTAVVAFYFGREGSTRRVDR